MLSLPSDLEPLPDYEWRVRPKEAPLHFSEVRTALWLASGNINNAAQMLRTDPVFIRKRVSVIGDLFRDWHEIYNQLLDKAESIAHEALHDPDLGRALPMAEFVLTKMGAERGWG